WLPSTQGVAAIMTAFDDPTTGDWNSKYAVAYKPQKASPPYPYPALLPGTAFGGANMNCLAPVGGDPYQPQLPDRGTTN
ncbi:MAG: hypothetical protein ACKORM_07535, partial [Solirubrobacterales bacterium]